MRCPDCNRFVGNEEEEPEVEVTASADGCSVETRIVNVCDQCGTELAEATFDCDLPIEGLEAHAGDGHDLDGDVEESSRTSRSTGQGRGRRTFYGFEATIKVACSCGFETTAEISDEIQASGMDPLT